MEGTKVLYLRVPATLHNELIQEAASRTRGDWERPNVQATCISLLTDALTKAKPVKPAKPTTKRGKKVRR